jgi:hypothetical protein
MNDQWLQWVDLGDCRQPEAKFRYQAISGTCSASNFTGDLFSVRPKAAIRLANAVGWGIRAYIVAGAAGDNFMGEYLNAPRCS